MTQFNPPERFAGADVARLRDIWHATLADFTETALAATDVEWDEPSLCPGWTVGDVVAHTLSLEAELHGSPIPDHEPDWAALPHVNDITGRYTEVPVDWYRRQPREVVVAELTEMLAWRADDLARDASTDPDEEVSSIAGWRLPRARMIRTRILDIWIHNQDIRLATGHPGALDSDGAWVTAEQLVSGIPFVWGKQLQQPADSSLVLRITGPGVEFSVGVIVGEDSRARFTDELASEPTVTATMQWPMFVTLAAGRLGAVARANDGGVVLTGDATTGQALVSQLVVTP